MEKIIKKKDKQFLWHPFTKINNQYDPIVISSAKNGNKHNNKKKLHTQGQRRGVFEIREYFVENTAHVRVVTFISYTYVIYIYTLFVF